MKELEDHNWFSPRLRNFQTEFIGFAVVKCRIYDQFIECIKSLSLHSRPMIDLCSGSGEPAITIFKKSGCFSRLILTDKFPGKNVQTNDRISYDRSSTDVLQMEFQSGNYYTMFNALHHFSDADKIMLAKKIRSANADAFFVEILEPHLYCFIKILLGCTIGSLLFTPFIRPFSFTRLFFTYIIPVNILTITFDGIISVFKSRSVNYYKTLFANQDSIEVSRIKSNLLPLIVIRIRAQ